MPAKSSVAKHAKITDVASLAGVSVTTVSMVLRGKGRISPATAARVQQAIATLHYVPNSAAVNLRSQQSNLVGLILRDITDPFYTEVTAGVSEVLDQQGYLLFLTQCGHSPERLQQSIQSLSRQGVAGIIFNPVRGAAASTLQALFDSALPVVCAARSYYRDDVDFIGPDNTLAAQQATTYLIEQGHRHIAYVGGRTDSLTRAERIGGYCASLLQYGLPFKPEWVLECERSQRSAADTISQLLHQHPKVTAVLCHSPNVALGGLYGVEASGRSVGKDNYIGQQVALLGFDDVAEAELTSPPLTFISSPAREIGRQAALRLLARMQQPDLTPTRHIITPHLQKRASA
ncbi:Mal regulon transcriptional regulator MalI [Aeromonas cavernicola]|uniref:Mal regulon transcriptional regulator MalI n=1 Tax=Aeromonas cavernicola TaxID=1006623 RepID=A0A2H9U1N0_9GAMM|nr:Mal regulon transcriptional regulator MalI [Aeromonas cavernicola]PJG57955.1 Mal regulon transcriptional regulator MalI [Aeromonas cavernicola]